MVAAFFSLELSNAQGVLSSGQCQEGLRANDAGSGKIGSASTNTAGASNSSTSAQDLLIALDSPSSVQSLLSTLQPNQDAINTKESSTSDANVLIDATREIAEHETRIPTTPGSAVQTVIEKTTGCPMSISSAVENAVANIGAEVGFGEAAELAGPIGAAVAAFGSSSTASWEQDEPLLWQQQWQELQEEISAYQFYKSYESQIEQSPLNNLFAPPVGQTPTQWNGPQIQNPRPNAPIPAPICVGCRRTQ